MDDSSLIDTPTECGMKLKMHNRVDPTLFKNLGWTLSYMKDRTTNYKTTKEDKGTINSGLYYSLIITSFFYALISD